MVTAAGDAGESPASAVSSVTISATGNQVNLVITPAAGISARYFNVYRSLANSASNGYLSALGYIGRVVNSGNSTTTFIDLDNRQPAFVTGFALDMRGLEIAELSPFKSAQLAQTDLTTPKAYFRFLSLMVKLPRFNILVDNLSK
jgi:hypothetical protein